jgi:NADH:flavin oxidoreductase / NADH oxidase family
LLEVTDAVVSVWGGDRVGVRIAPVSPANDIADSNAEALFTHVVTALNTFQLAYLHVVEGATRGPREVQGTFDLQTLRRACNGLYMANNGYDLNLAKRARREKLADLISFGRPFLANQDLVHRLRIGAPLNTPDQATFYGGDAHGYTDYPYLESVPRQRIDRAVGRSPSSAGSCSSHRAFAPLLCYAPWLVSVRDHAVWGDRAYRSRGSGRCRRLRRAVDHCPRPLRSASGTEG